MWSAQSNFLLCHCWQRTKFSSVKISSGYKCYTKSILKRIKILRRARRALLFLCSVLLKRRKCISSTYNVTWECYLLTLRNVINFNQIHLNKLNKAYNFSYLARQGIVADWFQYSTDNFPFTCEYRVSAAALQIFLSSTQLFLYSAFIFFVAQFLARIKLT